MISLLYRLPSRQCRFLESALPMSENASILDLLKISQTIAVVGLSDDPSKPSFMVAKYMQGNGYRVIPVNPRCSQILGETCYPDLASIPFAVDMVNVFRKPEDCLTIAHAAVAIGAKVLWLQLGIESDEACRVAQAGGLSVVMDKCLKIEHARCAL